MREVFEEAGAVKPRDWRLNIWELGIPREWRLLTSGS